MGTRLDTTHFVGMDFDNPNLGVQGALSGEPEFATRSPGVTARAHAAVAARHVRNALSLRTRSVLRDVRWRWTLNVLWTAA
jgi:hypothetical protein